MVSTLSTIAVFIVIWILFVFIGFFTFWIWPRTVLGWILSFAVGPIFFVIYQSIWEAIAEASKNIPSLRHAREQVERSTAHLKISAKRISYQFLEAAFLLGVFITIGYLLSLALGEKFGLVTGFFNKHFH